ncbi:MAG: peptidase domain-containing ABC transporter [Myxococcales bacterium]|nr:peptidase domain-containing ABC transporter [Myxococcales bacterium]
MTRPALFASAGPAALAALDAMAVPLELPAGMALTTVGQAVEGLWWLTEGLIEAQLPDDDEDEWLPGPVLRPGDLCGTHAAEPGATHTARLTSLTPIRLVAWPAGPLAEAAAAHPALAALLAALRPPGLRSLLLRLADVDADAAAALVALAPRLRRLSYGDGESIPLKALQILDKGALRAQGALLAPGSLVDAPAALLGVAPLHPTRAEGPVEVLALDDWATAPPALHAAIRRLATADGGILRGAPGPDIDASYVPLTDEPPPAYVPEGRHPGPGARLPFIRQRESMDCGAACLRMIHRYHGHALGHRFAVRLARVSRYGTSLFDLARAAEQLGYQAVGAEVAGVEGLATVDLPAIAHVDGEHFVVVWRVGRRAVLISDPAHGRLRIARAEFAERFSGAILLLRPTDLAARLDDDPGDAEPETGDFTPRRLWPFVRPFRRLLVHVLLASVLLQVLGLAVPFMTQVVIDRVISQGDADLLQIVLIGLVTLALMTGAVLFARTWLLIHGSLQIQRALTSNIFQRLLQASQRFFARFTSGDLIRRLQEVDNARGFFVDNALQATVDLVMMLGYAVILALLDPQLAALYLGVLAVSGVLGVGLAWPVRGHVFGFQGRMSRADTHVINALKGIEPIKALALERPFGRWYERLLVPALEQGRQAAQWAGASAALVTALQGVNIALLLGVGAGRVIDGGLTLGQLMAFLLLAQQLGAPFQRLLGQWRAFQATIVSLYRVGDLLDEVPEGEQQARRGIAVDGRSLRGEIELAGVTFRYHGDPKDAGKQILADVDLHLRPGEVVGVVGRSGCGKSTLARLLLRFHEPTSGVIRFDGIDARDLDPESLRSQIGLVTQEAFLYQASVRENVACGREGVTDEAIVAAVQAAGAYEFISELPFGFDTQVGERGLQLSGGQRQRLVIARALCTDPRVLIFDEATAALDPMIEAEIHERLRTVTAGRTTLIIAHRLHTLQHVDRIVVLDRGRVIEQGPHAALLAQGGLYAQMWAAAPRWEVADG